MTGPMKVGLAINVRDLSAIHPFCPRDLTTPPRARVITAKTPTAILRPVEGRAKGCSATPAPVSLLCESQTGKLALECLQEQGCTIKEEAHGSQEGRLPHIPIAPSFTAKRHPPPIQACNAMHDYAKIFGDVDEVQRIVGVHGRQDMPDRRVTQPDAICLSPWR